jgi:group I intron endonuclease
VIVYLVTNRVNGKRYVGKTKQPLERRWTQHKSAAKTCSKNKMPIVCAIRKYGSESFEHQILETCDSAEAVIAAEIRWIAELNTTDPRVGYNCTAGGEGLSHVTDEVRRRMSEAHKGKFHTAASRAKMSASHKGCVIGEAQRLNARQVLSKPVEALALDSGAVIARYSSTIEAERVSDGYYLSSKISLVCRGLRPHHRELGWRYLP